MHACAQVLAGISVFSCPTTCFFHHLSIRPTYDRLCVCPPSQKWSPLVRAASVGSPEIVELLLKHGCALNGPVTSVRPLHLLCYRRCRA